MSWARNTQQKRIVVRIFANFICLFKDRLFLLFCYICLSAFFEYLTNFIIRLFYFLILFSKFIRNKVFLIYPLNKRTHLSSQGRQSSEDFNLILLT